MRRVSALQCRFMGKIHHTFLEATNHAIHWRHFLLELSYRSEEEDS